ncbi:Tsi3 family protein [Corallococcus coralloides]|uniref:Tsi3 family protein n=1 Tax=Corallococcus coralloides TaxID=184914 RepID=UPI00384FDE77
MTTLRIHPPVAGYELRLAPQYEAKTRERGWVLTQASGAQETREPLQIAVDIIAGPAPDDGATVRVGERRLRRSVETSEGGSSGDAVTLTYVEVLEPDSVRYQQVRFSDGPTPRFELDDLIRHQGLLVVKTSPGQAH